jgi:hypothetical protein
MQKGLPDMKMVADGFGSRHGARELAGLNDSRAADLYRLDKGAVQICVVGHQFGHAHGTVERVHVRVLREERQIAVGLTSTKERI